MICILMRAEAEHSVLIEQRKAEERHSHLQLTFPVLPTINRPSVAVERLSFNQNEFKYSGSLLFLCYWD